MEHLRADVAAGERTPPPPELEALLERVRMLGEPDEPVPTLTPQPAPEPIPEPDQVPVPDPASPPATEAPPTTTGTGTRRVKDVVRVDAERLDHLVDTIGELVITQSMVQQSAGSLTSVPPQLESQLTQLDRITRELQQASGALRMVSVRPLFQRMARLVRDLAHKKGLPVEVVMSGHDTEIDRALVDTLNDPLVHLVRNAVDHGLEARPAQRQARGKPGTGQITLRAFHQGSSIYIEVEDDGRGIDREAVLRRARSLGLVREGETPADRDLLSFLFTPGFSTARELTEVSGRGVGLDVVARNIESLRGHIQVRSEPGEGTLFSLRLPLTLAVIDGMVIKVGVERYIVPTLSIVRSMRPEPGQVVTVLGQGEMLSLPDGVLPLFRLSSLFGTPEAIEDPTMGLVVVVEAEGRRAGLLTDELLGQQQIVIKSLRETLESAPGTAGAAIMPDGHVGLILDVGEVVKLAHAGESVPGSARMR
jgi:two-component system chemotaxis sensor kinase CheA